MGESEDSSVTDRVSVNPAASCGRETQPGNKINDAQILGPLGPFVDAFIEPLSPHPS